MRTLSLCTMVKGENSYLLEWIGHHIALGVEHFFVYDNESPEPLSATLGREIRRGLATVVPIAGRFKQLEAFNDGLSRFGRTTRWMGFMDIDEFLAPKRHGTIPELLEEYRNHGGLAINWQMFGSSGYKTRPSGTQIENYLFRAMTDYAHNRHVKSIIRPAAVLAVASTHHCVFRESFSCVNEKGDLVRGHLSDVSVDAVQITHYYTRSRAEFGEKVARGRVDRDIPMAFTFDQIDPDLNVVKDDEMLRFLPAVRRYLELRAED